MQALAREHVYQWSSGDLQVLDKVKAVHLRSACRHFGQIPTLRRRGTTQPRVRIGRAMAPEHAIDCGPRHLHRSLLVQRPLDGISAIFAEHAMLAQVHSRLQNAPLHGEGNTIPGATALKIGKREPIQTLSRTAGNPKRHRAHINPKLSSYGTHGVPSAHSPNHLTTLAFNRTFLAMTNSPQNPLPYRKCWTNAEPQVLDER
jgi:hypothetical protein